MMSSRAERSAVEGSRGGTVKVTQRDPSAVLGMTSRLDGELLEVSMGPQHPSTHGVFRMNVALDGEIVRKLKPVFGYLHRNHEKIGENTSYLGTMPYTDRLDYFCSMTNNWAYALSVEKLAGIEVPERAEYLRVILGNCRACRITHRSWGSSSATWVPGARRSCMLFASARKFSTSSSRSPDRA